MSHDAGIAFCRRNLRSVIMRLPGRQDPSDIAVEGVDALMRGPRPPWPPMHPTCCRRPIWAPRDDHGWAGNNGGDALLPAYGWPAGAYASQHSAAWAPHMRPALRRCSRQVAGWSISMIMIRLCVRPGHRRILGIGGRPGLPDPVARLVQSVEAGASRPSPSTSSVATGAAPGAAVRATRTVTFGERKPCHLLQPALSRCGEITVVDIGLGMDHDETADLVGLDEDGLAAAWPYPTERSDKYARGVVGVDTGSDQYPGAAVMSVYGAVYGGAGYVRFLGASGRPLPSRRSCRMSCFRPGGSRPIFSALGGATVPTAPRFSAQVAEQGLPAVVDADAQISAETRSCQLAADPPCG